MVLQGLCLVLAWFRAPDIGLIKEGVEGHGLEVGNPVADVVYALECALDSRAVSLRGLRVNVEEILISFAQRLSQHGLRPILVAILVIPLRGCSVSGEEAKVLQYRDDRAIIAAREANGLQMTGGEFPRRSALNELVQNRWNILG